MKKYSAQAYYNYARRMLEGEATAFDENMDPNFKALFNAVNKLDGEMVINDKIFISRAR